MTPRSLTGAILLALSIAGPLHAQAPAIEVDSDLPFATKRAIDAVLGAHDATVWTGESRVDADSIHVGSVVQVGGTLILAGRITGDLTAIDAEVRVRPGARVDRDLNVLGGVLSGSTSATVAGRETWLRYEPVAVVSVGPEAWRIDYVEVVERDVGFPFETKGLAGITVEDYNGVDGLSFGLLAGLKKLPGQPRTELTFGPVFRSARFDDVGWRVAGLREFPRAGGLVLGGSTYRVTGSPERWHRGDFSNSVASLFVADDDRTYFEKTGFEAWAERSFRLPFTVRLRWRLDEFESLESERPFALFGDDEDWPENPPIDDGQGRALGASVTWDRRNVPDFATAGQWARVSYERWGFGGDFEFDWAEADARAWLPLPVGEESFASLRAMASGNLGAGDTLAPQFWYRIGGGSTIPGYDARTPFLIGDRMAFSTATLHLGIPFGGRPFEQIYVVALGSIGDAWFDGDEFDPGASIGGGLAGHGQTSYVGVFGAYGIETEEWELYLRISPWF